MSNDTATANSEGVEAPGAMAPHGLRGNSPSGITADGVHPDVTTNISVKIPKAALSAGSKSVVVTLTKVGTKAATGKATTNFSGTGGIACPASAGCTVPGPTAAAGSDTFVITVFDALNGTGNLLATGTVVATVKAAPTKTTISPTVFAKTVKTAIVGSTSGVVGTVKAPTALALTAKDADGNVVTGTYANGVFVKTSDLTGAVTLSGGTVSGAYQVFSASTTVLKIAYSGLAITATTTIYPVVSGVTGTTGKFTVVPTALNAVMSPATTANELDLYATSGTGSSGTATLSQVGWTNSPYSKTLLYTFSAVTGSTSNCTSYTIVYAPTTYKFTVTAKAAAVAGKCNLAVTGGGGAVRNVILSFTTTVVGINGKKTTH